MGSILLLSFYIVLLVFQIVFMVKAIKNKGKGCWIKAFILEIISIIISICLWRYYESLPGYGFMSGLSYLGEVLLSVGVAILYSIVLFITMCAKVIVFEINQKREGKKYVHPCVLILALIFIVIGSLALGTEMIENWGKKNTVGVVVDYEEVRISGEIEKWPVIRYYVGNEKYEDTYPVIENTKLGDEVEIYYYRAGEDYKITQYKENNKIIYIPTLIIGIIIIIFRFKNEIFKSNKNNNK